MLDNKNVSERLLGFDIALTTANASDESLLGFLQAHMAELLVHDFVKHYFPLETKRKIFI